MKFTRLHLPGLVLIEPALNKDDRGFLLETFRNDLFKKFIGDINFMEDNEAIYTQGTLRGLRYQLPPFAQNILVSVVSGAVMDIAVDIRKGSPTFGKYEAVNLDSLTRKKLFVPKGFANGYLVLSKAAIVQTKADSPTNVEYEWGISNEDPSLGIDLHFAGTVTPTSRDKYLPYLRDAEVYQ